MAKATSDNLSGSSWASGRAALVTGSARRVGCGIVRALQKAGYCVTIHYNTSQKEAENLQEELNSARPESAHIIQGCLDQSLVETCKRLVREHIERWGRLDLVVNNASPFYKASLEDTTESMWDNLVDTNLKAPFFLIQAAAPYLRQQEGASIVNLGDIAGERGVLHHMAPYNSSKAGLIMMTKALALELGPQVRINVISPGAVAWPETDFTDKDTVKFQEEWLGRTPLGRIGTPEDVGNLVVFLASPNANFMTGANITLDGGRSVTL